MISLQKHCRNIGKQGGKSTLTKHGIEHFKKISKLAAKARRKKRKQNENL